MILCSLRSCVRVYLCIYLALCGNVFEDFLKVWRKDGLTGMYPDFILV